MNSFRFSVIVLQILTLQVKVHFSNTIFPLMQNAHKSQNHLILVLTTVHPEVLKGRLSSSAVLFSLCSDTFCCRDHST